MIITRTPFRISLFGGGSDFPHWFERNEGQVISFTIDKYCYISARILPPFFDYRYRIAYSKIETVQNFEDLQHPVVRECIREYLQNVRLEIHHDGDLPSRSGIGSSSAFTVGLIQTLLGLQHRTVSAIELAQLAIEMEQDILKENVGWQDQIACSIGGLNLIKFGPNKNWQYTPIQLKDAIENQLVSSMVLVFTGVHRYSSDISSGLLEGIRSKSRFLYRVMDLASAATEAILSSNGDLDCIGEMLDESWHLKMKLNASATTPLLNELYLKAKSAGALGGKVLGAGGGGFMLFWVPRGRRETFIDKLRPQVEVPFKICPEGSTVIYKDRLGR